MNMNLSFPGKMCLSPVKIVHHKGTSQEYIFEVPCGRCLECQRNKQNDYMQLFYLAAKQYGSMVFVTLTYNNNTLPYRVRRYQSLPKNIHYRYTKNLFHYDPLNGSYFRDKNFDDVVECSTDIESFWLEDFENMYGQKFNEHRFIIHKNDKCEPVIANGFDSMYVSICPSLRRRDVRLWIKRGRVSYEREFNTKLPKFKYVCVGEYGTKTSRPHYHLCFFGLDLKVVQYLCKDWNEKFGYTYCKNVPIVPSDGHDDVEAVGHYIAKYMTKGCFDKPFIRDGLVEKPRLIISINLVDVSSIKDYYRGVDFMPDDMPSDWYDLSQLSRLAKRQIFSINGKSYKLGAHLKKMIFYEKRTKKKLDGTVITSYEGDSLQNALASFERVCHIERVGKELFEIQDELCSEDWSEVVAEYEFRKENDKVFRKKNLYENMKKAYQKDRF